MLDRLKALFASFESHDVRYVVIGGIAAILHGVPRMTFDLDILIDPTPENAGRLLEAFLAADFHTADLIDIEQLLKNEITVFDDVERIDVQTRTPGIEFKDAWDHRNDVAFEGQTIHVVSREDLIASKRASGRPVDLEDVRCLQSDQ